MRPKTRVEEYWKEYPERDPEYVRWYPPDLRPSTAEQVWAPRDGDEQPKNIAVYVHVPFCAHLCKYCPFTKVVWSAEQAERYVAALERELRLTSTLPYLRRARVVAGYLGGGTPTSLTIEQLKRISSGLRECFEHATGAEMTIEANPDTIDPEKLRRILGLGFNRISLGVQSFDDELLVRIGRAHSGEVAVQAIEAALEADFPNVGIDLIYGLPGQTPERWYHDVTVATELGVHQVTVFGLYVAPGTPLHRETDSGEIGGYPDEAARWGMYEQADALLTAAGYQPYTAYDFALPGKACRHHAINWEAPQGEYLGLGPGAFSYVHDHIFANDASLHRYESHLDGGRLPVAKSCPVPPHEAMSRFMVLGLKCLTVRKDLFLERFGISVEERFGPTLARLEEWGLIGQDAERVWVTRLGKTYLGNVSKAFYSAEQVGRPQPRV